MNTITLVSLFTYQLFLSSSQNRQQETKTMGPFNESVSTVSTAALPPPDFLSKPAIVFFEAPS
jgi:hypothetical protein